MLPRIFLLCFLFTACAAFASAAQEKQPISFNDSALPRTTDAIEKFLPASWTVEEQVSGDLNNDSVPDTVLKLNSFYK